MHELDLVDNDIAFKICCFRLVSEFGQILSAQPAPQRLVLAEFVIRKKIARSSRVKDKASAQEQLVAFLAWAAGIEPTDEEIMYAAEIEAVAQERNIAFDTGESLLLAVLLTRGARRLYTGDKRAIEGLGRLSVHLSRADAVKGKVVCFEQIMLMLLAILGGATLAARVCGEPEIDKAASICCACASGGANDAGITEGLHSYIRDLRERSGAVLVA